MRFSVCISALYPHLPADEAIARVRACGADAYEFWHWQGIDRDKVRAAQTRHGVSLTGMCMPTAPRMDLDADAGFVKGLCDTIDLCRALSCPGIIVQAGDDIPGMSRQAQRQGLLAGLKTCAPYAEKAQVTLLLEPLNTRIDHKGYFLEYAQEAFELVQETGSICVRVLYDIYHQHITEGVSIPLIEKNMHLVGHFHLASYPGRHEPTVRDKIDTPAVLQAIEASGYQGCVGLEYLPATDADESLVRTLETLRNALR